MAAVALPPPSDTSQGLRHWKPVLAVGLRDKYNLRCSFWLRMVLVVSVEFRAALVGGSWQVQLPLTPPAPHDPIPAHPTPTEMRLSSRAEAPGGSLMSMDLV